MLNKEDLTRMDMILIGTQWNMQKKTARIRHAVHFGSEDFDVFIISSNRTTYQKIQNRHVTVS